MKGTTRTVLRRVLAMPWRERRLVARALVLVLAYRAALWVVPSSQVRRLATHPGMKARRHQDFAPERLAWIVRAVARRVPYATCLTQSLALNRLLAQEGHAAEIRIGVAKGERGLESHAWVVCHGRVLAAAGEDTGRYEPILCLGAQRP